MRRFVTLLEQKHSNSVIKIIATLNYFKKNTFLKGSWVCKIFKRLTPKILVYYFFDGKKVTKKANAKKGVFAYIFFKNKRKIVVRCAEVEIFIKISICITRYARSFGCSDIRWFLASHGANSTLC